MTMPPSQDPAVQVHLLIQRLDAVVAQQVQLADRLDRLTATLGDTYVSRREHDRDIGDINKDLDTQAAFRRQVGGGFIVGFLLLMVPIVAFLISSAGGGSGLS